MDVGIRDSAWTFGETSGSPGKNGRILGIATLALADLRCLEPPHAQRWGARTTPSLHQTGLDRFRKSKSKWVGETDPHHEDHAKKKVCAKFAKLIRGNILLQNLTSNSKIVYQTIPIHLLIAQPNCFGYFKIYKSNKHGRQSATHT